jgi:protein ImuA
MTQPPALSLARTRAAVLEELRRLLPGMAGVRKALPFGLATLDSYLPEGGLACGALHEVVPETQGAMPAALGFIAAILSRAAQAANSPPYCGGAAGVGRRGHSVVCNVDVCSVDVCGSPPDAPPCPPPRGRREKVPHPQVFVMPAYGFREYGRPHGHLYGHGFNSLGLDPGCLILVETAHRRDTLWAMEEALRSAAPQAVAGVIDKLDLKTSQRLHLAATDAGLPLLLLRPASTLESSAAATRWRIGTAEAARDRFGLFARPRWRLKLERCRNGRPGEWVVEYDHVAHRFSLAAALADPALARSAGEKSVRKTRCA